MGGREPEPIPRNERNAATRKNAHIGSNGDSWVRAPNSPKFGSFAIKGIYKDPQWEYGHPMTLWTTSAAASLGMYPVGR